MHYDCQMVSHSCTCASNCLDCQIASRKRFDYQMASVGGEERGITDEAELTLVSAADDAEHTVDSTYNAACTSTCTFRAK